MSTGEFYIVYINKNKLSSYDDVKSKINLSKSWYRINETIWILYTTSNANKWYARLRHLAEGDGSLFISKLDMNDQQGWMNQNFWDWIIKFEKK